MTTRQRLATFILAGSLLCSGAVAIDSSAASAAPNPTRSATEAPDQVATAAAAALAAIGTDQFVLRLNDVSYAVATRLGADNARLHQAWATADRSHQIALLSALSQVGVQYRRNSSKPGISFDCSGLTAYAWGQAGVALPRQSGAQIRMVAPRTRETAKAGDLAYYPGHAMIWLGVDNLIVHAADPARDVEVADISNRRASRAKFGDPAG